MKPFGSIIENLVCHYKAPPNCRTQHHLHPLHSTDLDKATCSDVYSYCLRPKYRRTAQNHPQTCPFLNNKPEQSSSFLSQICMKLTNPFRLIHWKRINSNHWVPQQRGRLRRNRVKNRRNKKCLVWITNTTLPDNLSEH